MTPEEKFEYYVLLVQEGYKEEFGYVVDTEWLRDILLSAVDKPWLR